MKLIAALLIAGPATAQIPTLPQQAAVPVPAPPARVWAAVLETLTANRIPLKFIDGTSRFAYTERFPLILPDSLAPADCGVMTAVRGLPSNWSGEAHVAITVSAISDTESAIRVVATFSTAQARCKGSTGSYEKLLSGLITAQSQRQR